VQIDIPSQEPGLSFFAAPRALHTNQVNVTRSIGRFPGKRTMQQQTMESAWFIESCNELLKIRLR
jgi:hypothetical protein